MVDGDMQRFAQGMSHLALSYPSHKPDEKAFAGQTRAYFDQMKDLEWRAVAVAFMRAPRPENHPSFFPAAGELRKLARDQIKAFAIEEEKARKAEEDKRDRMSDLERWKHVPVTPTGQQAYVEGGRTPFEQLGRMWECDSKRRGIQPHETTPRELHAERMGQFWKVWKQVTDARA